MIDPTLAQQTLWTIGGVAVMMSVFIGLAYIHFRRNTKGKTFD